MRGNVFNDANKASEITLYSLSGVQVVSAASNAAISEAQIPSACRAAYTGEETIALQNEYYDIWIDAHILTEVELAFVSACHAGLFADNPTPSVPPEQGESLHKIAKDYDETT